MKKQRGVALSGLIVWGIIIAISSMLGMKVAPDVIDFYKIRKNVKATAMNANGKTVPEIRNIFDRYANVDGIRDFEGKDLDISKEGNAIVITFAYERRVPLFANVSLLIDFSGSSAERD